jgi:hypothetical protein
VLDLPLQAQPWAREQGLALFDDLLAAGPVSQAASQAGLKLVSPAAGSIYRLSPGFQADAQRIRLEAVVEPGMQQVTLWIDGVLVSQFAGAPYQIWWTLAPGAHQAWVEAVRQNGDRVTSELVSFTVLAPDT